MEKVLKNKSFVDWLLLLFILPILGAGLVTMHSFVGETPFFENQLIWIGASILIFIGLSFFDFRFLRNSKVVFGIYIFFVSLLILLFVLGQATKGAISRFDLGFFSIQPVDFMKIALIIILSKYFSKRHVEIKNFKHILISGLYMLIPFGLVFLQPDFGSAMILFCIWLGMALVSGISLKHIGVVLGISTLAFLFLWSFILQDYQKARIQTFINPLTDIQGTGYNAYQSTVAVGSGKLFGKGVGYGTQSRLSYLPEHETDFIFAAFSEEWGFIGSIMILVLFALIIWRVTQRSIRGASNFEMLYGVGVSVMIISHVIINIGMNIGILPVTGITLPFMSYGGSHLISSFIALGIFSGMQKYSKVAYRGDIDKDLVDF